MALSENAWDNYKPSGGLIVEFPVEAGEVIYRGALCSIDADGYLKPGEDVASTFCAGVALDNVDNSGGADGAKVCRVDVGGAMIKVTHEDGSMTQANVGDAVVMDDSDSQVTSAGTGTNDIPAGRIIAIVSATTVWVKLYPWGIVS